MNTYGRNSPPSSVKVKNEWNYTSPPLFFHGLVRDNFIFTFTFTYARKILVHQYGSYHLLILRSDVEEEHVLCIESRCYSETMLI